MCFIINILLEISKIDINIMCNHTTVLTYKMGIPSYFSYIIKNYANIIRSLQSFPPGSFDHLYMDCNSIIYDSYHDI